MPPFDERSWRKSLGLPAEGGFSIPLRDKAPDWFRRHARALLDGLGRRGRWDDGNDAVFLGLAEHGDEATQLEVLDLALGRTPAPRPYVGRWGSPGKIVEKLLPLLDRSELARWLAVRLEAPDPRLLPAYLRAVGDASLDAEAARRILALGSGEAVIGLCGLAGPRAAELALLLVAELKKPPGPEVIEALARAAASAPSPANSEFAAALVALGDGRALDLALSPAANRHRLVRALGMSDDPRVIEALTAWVLETSQLVASLVHAKPLRAGAVLERFLDAAEAAPKPGLIHAVAALAAAGPPKARKRAKALFPRLLAESGPPPAIERAAGSPDPGRFQADGARRMKLPCGNCGAPAVTIEIQGGTYEDVYVTWTLRTPFQEPKINDRLAARLAAALRDAPFAEVAALLAKAWGEDRLGRLDPACSGCGVPYCKACWKIAKLEDWGGMDVGAGGTTMHAACPRGHEFDYEGGGWSYG